MRGRQIYTSAIGRVASAAIGRAKSHDEGQAMEGVYQ